MMLMQLNCKTQRLSVMPYDGKPYVPKCRRNCVRWKTRDGCRRLERSNPTQIQMTLKNSMKQLRRPMVPRIILCIQWGSHWSKISREYLLAGQSIWVIFSTIYQLYRSLIYRRLTAASSNPRAWSSPRFPWSPHCYQGTQKQQICRPW